MANEFRIAAEWVDGKSHYLFRRGYQKIAYARPHGGGKRWDVFDADYAKLMEIPAKSREEALERVTAWVRDGSLERSLQKRLEQRKSAMRTLAIIYSGHAKELELHSSDGLVRPCIPLQRETHRLLRAVAIKRSRKIPGGPPSIAAVVEELVDRSRGDLEREAGAIFKRELAKKR
jgi:hypothetical protein